MSAAANTCRFCGNRLATGAVACFRCGRMVERESPDTTGGGSLPTQLGTQAKGELLENQWRLVKPIGQGGAGIVWQAQDVGLDRAVAVKIMHDHLLGDAVARARFERESKMLATLEHPHIVPVLGVGTSKGRPFVVMKLLEGRSLAEHLHARGGRLPLHEAVPLLQKLSEALDFVHAKDVLHRDLKPSNVFIGNEGQLWLLDFGLAFEAGSDLTQSRDVLGAVAYLSPEQLMGRRDLDRRADVFSLGCLAFEILTGSTPFVGEPRDILAHQLHTLPPDAGSLVPDLPSGVGALLRKALAKVPLERPHTASELAGRLAELAGLGSGPVPRSSPPALVLPVRRSSKEVPASLEQPTREANTEPTPQFERDRVTAPNDAMPGAGPLVAPEFATGPGEPTHVVGQQLGGGLDDATRQVAAIPRDPAGREGPTGPTRAQRRAASLTMVGLAALGVLIAGLIAYAFTAPVEPLPGVPLALPRTEHPVAIVEPSVHVDPNLTLAPPDVPKAPAITSVEPGKETYKPIDYTKLKEVRPRHVAVRGGRTGNGAPELEIRVFAPESAGRKELKADVMLDGLRKGLSPLKLKPTIGPHLVQVEYPPYPVTDMDLMALPGAKQSVEIELLPVGAEAWAPAANPEPKVNRSRR
jgi:serine/threonine protein kinase